MNQKTSSQRNKPKLKFLFRGLREQLPIKRFIRNFFITGNAWGMFSIHSHVNKKGNEKVGYNTKKTALKSAEAMKRKYKYHYSTYFCIFCGKYHVGKNRTSVKNINNGK